MSIESLGSVYLGAVVISIQEDAVAGNKISASTEFRVKVLLPGGEVEATLSEIRALRNLLNRAETRLQLRDEQALRCRNMQLDLN